MAPYEASVRQGEQMLSLNFESSYGPDNFMFCSDVMFYKLKNVYCLHAVTRLAMIINI